VVSAADRKRVGRAFHRHAAEYDHHASVQKRVIARLERLMAAHLHHDPQRVLDIGCGTGTLLAVLHGLYPRAGLCGVDLAFNMARQSAARLGDAALLVNGDAEQLPFREGVFDLVVSSSTFQWLDRLDCCFQECHRVLKEGGLLCVAFFGGRTLWELRDCYQETVRNRFGAADARQGRMHRFRERDEVQRALSGFGYDQVLIANETEMEYHADVSGLLRSIKSIGAATAARSDAGGGLGWRSLLADMANLYEERFLDGGMIPATYEVIYVVARKGPATSPVTR
jgi:malonyl-CoA O-methyltransferase